MNAASDHFMSEQHAKETKMISLVTNVANLGILHAGVTKENLSRGSGVARTTVNHTVTEYAVSKQRTD